MSCFRFTGVNCVHYPTEWSAVVTQIQSWPSAPEYYDYKHPLPRQISHHLEAKALYVFTMARRLVRAAYKLGGRTHRTEKANWKLIFVEVTSLLFPMIELVGHARLGTGGSNASLCVGVHWLHNPQRCHQPRVTQADRTLVPALLNLEVGHLVSLRNYYLHGSKNVSQKPVAIADIMNYKLPQAMAQRAEEVIPIYWKQLKQDDGNQKWVERLALADIRPFEIQGSGVFEAGLVDPDVVDYLEGCVDIFGVTLQC
jgi:hypothetical protein